MVLFYQPLKRKKVTERDLGSDNESCPSQSILTNYKQKVYSQTQTYEEHRNEPNHAPKNGNDEEGLFWQCFNSSSCTLQMHLLFSLVNTHVNPR